jgi:hypothetical protein
MSESQAIPGAQTQQAQQTQPAQQLEPAEQALVLERLRSEQNLGGAIAAGAAAAAAGAAAWAAVTVFTHFQIGWMAVGVGFLVGFAVRRFGKGLDRAFGFVGAGCALLGCLAGNLLAACGMAAQEGELGFLAIVSTLDLDTMGRILALTFSPMDLLFYGIAVYEGWKLSFRQISMEELARARG